MEITREYLVEGRAEYVAQLQRHRDNANAVEGAIQMIDHLLARLDSPPPVEEDDADNHQPSTS